MTLVTKRGVILAVLVLAVAGAALMKARRELSRPLTDVTIAVSMQPLSAPLYVAREKEFFTHEGLRVTLAPYHAGVDAMNAAMAGKADLGTVADVPVMFAGLKGEQLSVVATIASTPDYMRIVARRDRLITRPADLRGKTFGVRAGTSSEYFLAAFLTFHGISPGDVRTVDMPLPRMAEALAKGEIDAAVSWDPYASDEQKALGKNAVTFTNYYLYILDWNIVGRSDYVKAHPEVMEKLLKALIKATSYIQGHPEESEAATARGIGKSTVSLRGMVFDVHLDQSLIVNLEAQARWAIRSGHTDRKTVPDYLSMLYTKGLERVNPKAVTVIR